MSRKLGALTLAMSILVGAMALKTVVSSHAKGTPVMVANGPDPVPLPPKGSGLL